MAIYVIADLHLSTVNASKSMEVFGNRWTDYQNKIKKNWERVVSESDTVIIPGDISWALSLNDALPDLKFLSSLPGKKIIMKGNHDFWWNSVAKMKKLFCDENIKNIDILNNNAIEVEDLIITGSRGWFIDPSTQTKSVKADFDKINNRELIRLRIGLEQAKEIKEKSPQKEIIVFSHFPVVWAEFKNQAMIDLLSEYGIKRCFFGHIHGSYALPGLLKSDNIEFRLISADYLEFIPFII